MADRTNRLSGWLRIGRHTASFAFTVAAFVVYVTAWREQEALGLAYFCSIGGSFLSTFVHELGHAVAALACRWRVITFVVRPLGVHLFNRSIAWIGSNTWINGFGWVLAVPRRAAVDTAGRKAVMIAGGPAASFALAAGAFAAWWLMAPSRGYPSASRLFLGFAIQALNAGLFTLAPGVGDTATDGDKLRELYKSPGDYSRDSAAIWIGALLKCNVRLRDLPAWLLDQARAAATNWEDGARRVAAVEIGIVLDSSPVDAVHARALIEDFRTRFGADGWLAACDSYLAAMWEGDVNRASDLLVRIGPEPDLAQMNHAAHAAVAVRAGQIEVARWHLKEMKIAVRKSSAFADPTFRDIARQIEALIREAQRARRAAQAAAPASSAGPPFRTKRLSQ